MSGLDDATLQRLTDDAVALYRSAGRFAFHFARGKLSRDPLFTMLLRAGAIPDASCLVDLGCGQGLLAAWLHVARKQWTSTPGTWPVEWPAAPKVGTYLGVDQSRREIARGKRALPAFARSLRGDVRKLGTMLDRCDVVTLFDVLHYLKPAAQEELLSTIARRLPPWGVLLMRIGNGRSTMAARRSNLVDLTVCALRGHPRLRLHRRPVAEWTALLEQNGFVVERIDDVQREAGDRARGTSGNLLLRASRPGEGMRLDELNKVVSSEGPTVEPVR